MHASKKIFYVFLLICLLNAADMNSVHAKDYEITIKPSGIVGETKTVICKDNAEICFLTFPVWQTDVKKREYIQSAIRIYKGDLEVDFMLRGYRLSTSRTDMNYFKIRVDNLLEEQKISLFFLHPKARERIENQRPNMFENKKILDVFVSLSPALALETE